LSATCETQSDPNTKTNTVRTIRFIITLFEKERRPRLESKARELGIASSVRFTGAVSPEELAVCYHRCSVFAMPARTELDTREPRGEGFGIVYLEAMAHSKAARWGACGIHSWR